MSHRSFKGLAIYSKKDVDELYLEKLSDKYLRLAGEQKVNTGAHVLSITGPPGSGKTTVVKTLRSEYQAYIETLRGNRFLSGRVYGKGVFNAVGNQDWFLRRIEAAIESANSERHLIIDQDPAAVVRVYCRFYYDRGEIDRLKYVDFLKRLMKLEGNIGQWRGGRMILFLTAAPEILHERCQKKTGGKAPPLVWFRQIQKYFGRLQKGVRNPLVISTDKASVKQVVEATDKFLCNRESGIPYG